MKRKREDNTARTKQVILNEAERLISKHGCNGLTVTKVAKALSMSHANVYRHFSSKGDLIAAVASVWMKEMRESCEKAISFNGSAEQKLASLISTIRAQLDLRSQNPSSLQVYLFMMSHRPEEAKSHQDHRRSLFTSILGCEGSVLFAVEDAFRYYTDPNTFKVSTSEDEDIRIENLIKLVAQSIKLNRS